MAIKQEPKSEPIEPTLPHLPLPPPSTPTPAPPLPDPKKDSDTIQSLTSHKRATSWSIHRYPLEKYIIPDYIFHEKRNLKTRILLPRGYAGKGGVDVGYVKMGEDLNRVVWGWYDKEVGREGKWAGEDNFVAGDNICAKRHEFLGPDPRVAGYTFDYDGEVHIKWWDGFLKDQWVENQKWKFEFVRDANGNLVEKSW